MISTDFEKEFLLKHNIFLRRYFVTLLSLKFSIKFSSFLSKKSDKYPFNKSIRCCYLRLLFCFLKQLLKKLNSNRLSLFFFNNAVILQMYFYNIELVYEGKLYSREEFHTKKKEEKS